MPIFIAPIAGLLSDRVGGRRIVAVGLFLQAVGLGWLATVASPTVSYLTMVPGLAISGFGMALFFAPVANLVLSSVRHEEQGIASGAHNAIRELGGVFGVAVLASVFAHSGGYTSPQAFTNGVVPAVWVGAAVVALGGVAALLIPRHTRSTVTVGGEAEAATVDTRLQPTTA
jgi:MFS family permease